MGTRDSVEMPCQWRIGVDQLRPSSQIPDTPLRVLIVGAGIAGPALVFWLHRLGHACTILERWDTLRVGGQQIDIRCQGIDLIKHMGIIRRHSQTPSPRRRSQNCQLHEQARHLLSPKRARQQKGSGVNMKSCAVTCVESCTRIPTPPLYHNLVCR